MSPKINKEILNSDQVNLLKLLDLFKDKFGLIGGTALALQIGHRKSIDFDLATNKEFSNQEISNKLIEFGYEIEQVLVDSEGELTVLIQGVKITFLFYPFSIDFEVEFEGGLKLASVLTIAALKAYALGRRAKWKDYVDLFFVMKDYYSLQEINQRAEEIFGKSYNEKLFRSQLAYFEDIDYSEKVDFEEGFSVEDQVVKQALISFSLS